MKKSIIIMIIFTILLVVPVVADMIIKAENIDVEVHFNGEKQVYSNPILKVNGKTYIPVRETAENLGWNLEWDEKTGGIDIEIRDKHDYVFEYTKDGMYGLMDAEGNILLEAKYNYVGYSEGIACVQERVEGEYKYINLEGKQVIPQTFKRASSFINGSAIVTVEEDGFDWNCYIDKEGNPIFDRYFCLASNFYEGYAVVIYEGTNRPMADNTFSYINEKGEFATDKIFEDACSFKNGFAVVKNNGKYGLIDKNFNLVIDYIYEETLYSVYNGMLSVKKNGKWGVVDTSGKTIIDFQYDGLRNYLCGLIAAEKDGKWGYIDIDNNIIIPFQFDVAQDFSEGLAIVDFTQGINKKGETVIKISNKELGIRGCNLGLILVYDNDGNSYYMTKDGEKIIPKKN